MNSKVERCINFVLKERTRNFVAFIWYFCIMVIFFEINLPLALNIICSILFIITALPCAIYMVEWLNKIYERNINIKKNIKMESKKIFKEILMCIPVIVISICINSFVIIGEPANQISIEKSFNESWIWNSISIIIIGPIIEELIFRFLPYKFIKNKTLYIIVSSVIFAAAHVVSDPNPFYYIWCYMIKSLYYGYRYYKTKDIWVTISVHSFSNLIAVILMIL